MTMGSRIAIMHEGRLQQVGRPQGVYRRPANLFVAGFIGSPAMNLLDARVERRDDELIVTCATGEFRLEPSQQEALRPYEGAAVVLGVRPEHLDLAGPGVEAAGVLRATVDTIESLGHEAHVTFRAGEATLVARLSPELELAAREEVTLAASSRRLHFFDPATRQRIPAEAPATPREARGPREVVSG
jgi:multiple sugar transport system ATP-binding protein